MTEQREELMNAVSDLLELIPKNPYDRFDYDMDLIEALIGWVQNDVGRELTEVFNGDENS